MMQMAVPYRTTRITRRDVAAESPSMLGGGVNGAAERDHRTGWGEDILRWGPTSKSGHSFYVSKRN